MKNTKAIILLVILLFATFFTLRLESDLSYELNREALYAVKSDVPDNFDELLNEEYGVSEYFTQIGDIRVSVAKTVSEKHYIKYSWINYDVSSFTAYIIIENMTGADVKNDAYATAIISDKHGLELSPYHSELTAWPSDDPLGCKVVLCVCFVPPKTPEKSLDFTVFFDDEKYVIENVNFT